MKGPHFVAAPAGNASSQPPEAEVVIEVPRGGFLKRGSSGSIDFVSPLPCPFNYGAVPTLLGPSSFRVETNNHNGWWWSGPVGMWASRASGLSTCPWGGVELMRLRVVG